jgi:hypothetical protein
MVRAPNCNSRSIKSSKSSPMPRLRNDRRSAPVDPASLPIGRLIQHIVRVHHQYVRQELPRLAEMAQKLAAKRSDRAPELKNVEELLEELRADMFAHIQKEEQVLFPFISQMDQDSIVAYPPAHACFRSVAHPVSKMMQEHESANHTLLPNSAASLLIFSRLTGPAPHTSRYLPDSANSRLTSSSMFILKTMYSFHAPSKMEAELNSRE